jgi:hypothetical protein
MKRTRQWKGYEDSQMHRKEDMKRQKTKDGENRGHVYGPLKSQSQNRGNERRKFSKTEKVLNRKGGKIENSKDFDRYVGGKINDKIDKGGRHANKIIHEGVGRARDKLIGHGFDKNLVEYGSRIISKTGGKLIREGVGKAKHWIHHEGRHAVNHGIHKVKEGFEHAGRKIKDWFKR